MKVRFSPQIPFLMGFIVRLEQLGRAYHTEDEDDEDPTENGSGLDISTPNCEDNAFNVLATIGDSDNPVRQVLLELEAYEGFEQVALFTITCLNQDRTEDLKLQLSFDTEGNQPSGLGQTLAEIAWKYLSENAVPDLEQGLPEGLNVLS